MSNNSKNFVRIDSQGRVHIPGTKTTKPRTLVVPKLKQPDKTEVERNYTKSLNRKHGTPLSKAVELEEPLKNKGITKNTSTDTRLSHTVGAHSTKKKGKTRTSSSTTKKNKSSVKNQETKSNIDKTNTVKITPGVTNPDQINSYNLEELSENGTPVYDDFGNLKGVIITEKDGNEYYYHNSEYGDGMKQPLYDLEDVERLTNGDVDISDILEEDFKKMMMEQVEEPKIETETPAIEPNIEDIEQKKNKPIITEENQEEVGILARGYVTIITNFIDNIRGFDFELSLDEKERFRYIYDLWSDALLDPTYMRAFASALEKNASDMIEQTAIYIFYEDDGIRSSALTSIEQFIYSTISSVNEGYNDEPSET